MPTEAAQILREKRAARRTRAIERINAAREHPLEVYNDHGAFDRFQYLEQLAEQNGLKLSTVLEVASLLGPGEDFDGLVTHLEDGFHTENMR